MDITFADAGHATNWLNERDHEAKRLRRMTMPTLRAIVSGRSLMSTDNLSAWSRDDLISYALEINYPLESVNLAIHVRTHTQSFPDCPHCQADDEAAAEERICADVARLERQGRA
jgi:hypothetical protein